MQDYTTESFASARLYSPRLKRDNDLFKNRRMLNPPYTGDLVTSLVLLRYLFLVFFLMSLVWEQQHPECIYTVPSHCPSYHTLQTAQWRLRSVLATTALRTPHQLAMKLRPACFTAPPAGGVGAMTLVWAQQYPGCTHTVPSHRSGHRIVQGALWWIRSVRATTSAEKYRSVTFPPCFHRTSCWHSCHKPHMGTASPGIHFRHAPRWYRGPYFASRREE